MKRSAKTGAEQGDGDSSGEETFRRPNDHLVEPFFVGLDTRRAAADADPPAGAPRRGRFARLLRRLAFWMR